MRKCLLYAFGGVFIWGSLVAAAVDVSLAPPQIYRQDKQTRTIQSVTLANEIIAYTLTYDYITHADKPNEASSHWWGWTAGFIPIGMTEPSQANFYWQAFFNWRFDEESLHLRPAQLREVRRGGPDGLIEFVWDTPKVKASVYFGLASGSDKLLMFGEYEPKAPVNRSFITFSIYPATFAAPHNRAVTTVRGTKNVGEFVELDLAQERWILFEDITPNRSSSGSAGLLIGTPESFARIAFSVASYGITPTLELKPEARRFALGLYDFPALPDFQQTREYFRRCADKEAELIGQISSRGLAQAFPAMPIEAQMLASVRSRQEKIFERAVERWQPSTELFFPWASPLPGKPIKVALYVPRWRAWETMALAKIISMDVEHIYFDGSNVLSHPNQWPYAGTTGQGPVPYGVALQKAVSLAQDPDVDVFFVAALTEKAMPRLARREILQQVAAGKGLLLAASGAGDWPPELFQKPNEAVAQRILADLAWEHVPGLRPQERGGAETLVQAFDYEKGRVILLNVRPTTYGCLVPANNEIEGQNGVFEHALFLAARALQAAAKREPAVNIRLHVDAGDKIRLQCQPLPPGATAYIQVRDELDNVYTAQDLFGQSLIKLSGPETILPFKKLPKWPGYFVDVRICDSRGLVLGNAFAYVPPAANSPAIKDISISPRAQQPAEALIPKINLPAGGMMTVSAAVARAPAGAQLFGEAYDAFGRLMWRALAPVAPTGSTKLTGRLLRPVTICHQLELAIRTKEGILARARQHFAVPRRYPYDDFTGLMWSYPGGDPVIQRTNRLCYEWGAEMMDLCHMGGYEGMKAAREYLLAARSGLRLLPYVTRIAGEANQNHERVPCLHDPDYIERTNTALIKTCSQAQTFSPAAYTLGDENYLFSGPGEVCHSSWSVAAFQKWLKDKYGEIAALNAAWGLPAEERPAYTDFAEIKKPMLLAEAAQQEISFAPWLDHKLFMAEAFAAAHDLFRETIRSLDPQAKVGYDGFLGFNWQSGYDFERLARHLELNQTYTEFWIQGELVRSFKRPDALTGKWGNSDADTEEGWHAFPWHCLLDDDNSVWWWTSWGCDYIPFNPDLSISQFGKWFYESLRETTQGAGKLLLHAKRELSPVAIYHSQTDFYFADVLQAMGLQNEPFSAGGQYLNEETAFMFGARDYGCQYEHITPARLDKNILDPARYRVLFMPFASCISDEQAVLLQDYVQRGGTLVADGRIGMLTGEGKIRTSRLLDDLFGVTSEAGLQAIKRPTVKGEIAINNILTGTAAAVPLKTETFHTNILEPGLRLGAGTALARLGEIPLLIVNQYGAGRAILLNIPLQEINIERTKPGLHAKETIIRGILQSAGVSPLATIVTEDGGAPLCLNTVAYQEGRLHYLAIMHDFRIRNVPEQQIRIRLDGSCFVYDMRAGQALGKLKEYKANMKRGYPLVLALLPYRVLAIKPQMAASAVRGQELAVKVSLQATQPPDYHVVRLDVYPPGASQPHRQYSQNISCPQGQGQAIIPFAYNDQKGVWRLVWRDVATGTTAENNLTLK